MKEKEKKEEQKTDVAFTHKKPPAGAASVKVSTWGTAYGEKSGLAHFVNAVAYGTNVGHAAIEITLPADDVGVELIKKYCDKDGKNIIPFERKVQNVVDETGKIKQTEVFAVYWSWFPGTNGFSLSDSINTDNQSERPGVNVGQFNPSFEDKLEPLEERQSRGKLGSKKINLSIQQLIHVKSDFTEQQLDTLDLHRQLSLASDKLKALEIIKDKLAGDGKSQVKIEGTLKKLLDQNIIGWEKKITNIKSPTKQDLETLTELVIDQTATTTKEQEKIQEKYEDQLVVLWQKKYKKVLNDVENLRIKLDKLSPEEKKELLQKKESGFSKEVWSIYERQEITKLLEKINVANTLMALRQDLRDMKRPNEKNYAEKITKYFIEAINKSDEKSKYNKENLAGWDEFLPERYKGMNSSKVNATIIKQMFENADMFFKSTTTNDIKELTQKLETLGNDSKYLMITPSFLQGSFEQNVTMGLPPDNSVLLPVGSIKKGEKFQLGLNVEGMLEQMSVLAQDKKNFSMATKNCSITGCSILEHGCEDEKGKKLFNKKFLTNYAGPQEVFNGALEYQKEINNQSYTLTKTTQNVQQKSDDEAIKNDQQKILTLDKNNFIAITGNNAKQILTDLTDAINKKENKNKIITLSSESLKAFEKHLKSFDLRDPKQAKEYNTMFDQYNVLLEEIRTRVNDVQEKQSKDVANAKKESQTEKKSSVAIKESASEKKLSTLYMYNKDKAQSEQQANAINIKSDQEKKPSETPKDKKNDGTKPKI